MFVKFNASKGQLLDGEPFSFYCRPPEHFGKTEESCYIYKYINRQRKILTEICNSTQPNFVARCQDGTLQLSSKGFIAADAGEYLCNCFNPAIESDKIKPANKSISLFHIRSFKITFFQTISITEAPPLVL